MIKLITTDSYFNLFNALKVELKDKVNSLTGKNLIFCEEKVSLMVERIILGEYGGSFNTTVYSFGNYMRERRPCENTLSKEGSSMAVKRILSTINLGCFRASKTNLAPSLYNLLILLKSAKVSPEDLERACQHAQGVLKNKLQDITNVYREYQAFIENSGLDDQSSLFNYLQDIIENDSEIENASVYLVGFNGWTSQIRSGVSALLKRAKSVTAILTEGNNPSVYVNETANAFIQLAKDLGKKVEKSFVQSPWVDEGKIIAQNLFNPTASTQEKIDTDKVFTLTAPNSFEEAERVAQIIRQKVLRGERRYRDFTVCVPQISGYRDQIVRAFNMQEIPFFLDEKKKVGSHPLIKLILSYIDAKRKNLEKETLAEFYKNPLFNSDKELADEFENYVLAYNVDYGRIKKAFTFEPKGEKTLEELNAFREKICACFDRFSINDLLKNLEVESKINEYSLVLEEIGEKEESAINAQIYQKVTALLLEMDMMLGAVTLPLNELKAVITSGVSAMELSIIPQYNDAVFVGSFKETGLAQAKTLFVMGLTDGVPAVKDDVALLNDNDISSLEQIQVLVEPKIRVVNHRARENVGLGVSAFAQELYLSYPLVDGSGNKNSKSEVLKSIEGIFNVKPFPEKEEYLSFKEGLNSFARSCSDFAESKLDDFTNATSFYRAVGEEQLKGLLERSNQEIKTKLKTGTAIMEKSTISPTAIESYYKCPYRAFLSQGLKLKKRESGVVDMFSIGNLVHEIFGKYLLEENFKKVTDEKSSYQVVLDLAKSILANENYSKFLSDGENTQGVKNAIDECAKFCYKNYLALQKSTFKVAKTEVPFNDYEKGGYPAIKLLDGKVKMVGVIDRVDETDNYFRVLDYKTKASSSDSDLDMLFKGKKLQLYLYAAAVNHDKEKQKTLAGVYYMPIADKFRKQEDKEDALSLGHTLEDEPVLLLHDAGVLDSKESIFLDVKENKNGLKISGKATEEQLKASVEYALELSEQAVKQMRDGVIAPSPCEEKICEYCEYVSMCNAYEPNARTVNKVDAQVIEKSIKGEE